jgi:nickel/cobalt exporter
LGIAGGLLPDPGALAILLASLASGKLILGLLTVIVFSLGFASVLVIVGVVAARVGRLILTWLSSRWIEWVQVGAALVILGVGVVLTTNAWRTIAAIG